MQHNCCTLMGAELCSFNYLQSSSVLSGSGVTVLSDSGVTVLSDSGVTVLSDSGVTVLSDSVVTVLSDSGVTVLSDSGVTVLSDSGVTVLSDSGVTVLSDSGVATEPLDLLEKEFVHRYSHRDEEFAATCTAAHSEPPCVFPWMTDRNRSV